MIITAFFMRFTTLKAVRKRFVAGSERVPNGFL